MIPLYQKAILDEAIARKKLKLKKTKAALDKAYVSVREIATRQFVSMANEKCLRFSRFLQTFNATTSETKS